MKTTKYKKKLLIGNCLDTLKQLANDSIDSVVTDPPYELGFMGKSWDSTGIAFNVDVWQECLRVLKPGGHLIAFSGSRTYHRMAVAIEDAGFEIRDQIMWVYGSGFPKSMDIAKAIDKAAGANVIKGEPFNVVGGTNKSNGGSKFRSDHPEYVKPKAITDKAKQWQGWGTALKPAHEPMVLARKPLSEKTVAANVLTYGTGAINIDASRVGNEQLGGGTLPDYRDVGAMSKEATGIDKLSFGQNPRPADRIEQPTYTGRFPANFIHDGSDEVVALFPNSKGNGATGGGEGGIWTKGNKQQVSPGFTDNGTAARFFYCAKASKSERNGGLDGLPIVQGGGMSGTVDKSLKTGSGNERDGKQSNFHPTVKPLALMRYLINLVTPPNGTVLDPFLGSGTTAVAATLDNFNWVGCEMTEDYLPIIKGRVDWATKENKKAKQQELDLHENN